MYIDVMVSDASKRVWKNATLFDAIITDRRFFISKPAGPIIASMVNESARQNDVTRVLMTAPYGIRESTRRTGSHKDITKPPDGT